MKATSFAFDAEEIAAGIATWVCVESPSYGAAAVLAPQAARNDAGGHRMAAFGGAAWPSGCVARLTRHLGVGGPRIAASAARPTGRANPPP